MADSRAERRWSKEPRMAIMLSVMVWLFWSDSRIDAARSLRASIARGIPILSVCLSVCLSLSLSLSSLSLSLSLNFLFGWRENEKREIRDSISWIFSFERRHGRELKSLSGGEIVCAFFIWTFDATWDEVSFVFIFFFVLFLSICPHF